MTHLPISFTRGRHPRWPFVLVGVMVLFAGAAVVVHHRRVVAANQLAAASSPATGFPMGGLVAPGFVLTDQFGKKVSLSQFRGKEVVWALIDSKCTTICPLTAQILTRAVDQLGARAKGVQLVAVNANPLATSVATVRQWSVAHGMLHRWLFVTGSPAQLQHLYSAYRLADQVVGKGKNATIVHDSAVLIIDRSGREQLYFNVSFASPAMTVTDQVDGITAGMRQWLPRTAGSAA